MSGVVCVLTETSDGDAQLLQPGGGGAAAASAAAAAAMSEDDCELPPNDFSVSPPAMSPSTSLLSTIDSVDVSHKKGTPTQ